MLLISAMFRVARVTSHDAVWISDLLAHGLIRASFVPPNPIQEVRDLTRTRTQLTREVAQHVQRIQKTLEDANIKLVSVISDIMGMSGRRILKAMIAGETNAMRLSELGSARLKCSRSDLAVALDGRVTAHHRFLIDHHLGLIEELERRIAAFDARIEELLGALCVRRGRICRHNSSVSRRDGGRKRPPSQWQRQFSQPSITC